MMLKCEVLVGSILRCRRSGRFYDGKGFQEAKQFEKLNAVAEKSRLGKGYNTD